MPQPQEMSFHDIVHQPKMDALYRIQSRITSVWPGDIWRIREGATVFKLVGMPERYEFLEPVTERRIKRALLPVELRAEPGRVTVLDSSMSVFRDIMEMVLDNVPPHRTRWQRFMDRVCSWLPFLWRFHEAPPVMPEYMEVRREMRQHGAFEYPAYKVRWVA